MLAKLSAKEKKIQKLFLRISVFKEKKWGRIEAVMLN
jgi:hypothetical protein